MVSIVNKFFLLIILFILQSCSGGRIGNFLESSFKNIEDTKIKGEINTNLNKKIVTSSTEIAEKNENNEDTKIKEEININLNKKMVTSFTEIAEKNKNIEEIKAKEDQRNDLKNINTTNTEKKGKKNKKITEKIFSLQNRKYKPKSYKIIFILKDVDPKDPTENLRTILGNSDVNFEIEKIERYVDPKNKSLKIN